MAILAYTINKEDFSPIEIEEFWLKVDKRGPNDCWLWKLNKTQDGYGALKFHSKGLAAHRVAYTLTIGPIEKGLLINHLCCNRACCNPSHMEICTCKDNIAYAVKLGRMATGDRHGRNTKPECFPTGDQHWTRSNIDAIKNCLVGENNPRAKLTEKQVLEIKALYATGKYKQKQLANQFMVSYSAIRNIIYGRSWTSVQ